MTDFLTKFQAKKRFKVDAELIRRWEWDARYNGDKNIKTQISGAKRTATTLTKAKAQFTNLRPEHELAMNAAASALQSLVAELQPLAAWAKEYKVFCEAERKKTRADELEAIANKRWGTDEAKFQFEFELIQELCANNGRAALGRWMHSKNAYKEVIAENFFSPIGTNFGGGEISKRLQAASKIEEAMRSQDRTEGWNNKHVHCSWADYEDYLAYRKDVAKTSKLISEMAGNA